MALHLTHLFCAAVNRKCDVYHTQILRHMLITLTYGETSLIFKMNYSSINIIKMCVNYAQTQQLFNLNKFNIAFAYVSSLAYLVKMTINLNSTYYSIMLDLYTH